METGEDIATGILLAITTGLVANFVSLRFCFRCGVSGFRRGFLRFVRWFFRWRFGRFICWFFYWRLCRGNGRFCWCSLFSGWCCFRLWRLAGCQKYHNQCE